MLVPVRDARPHVGFVWFIGAASAEQIAEGDPEAAKAVVDLMSLVEAAVPFHLQVLGMVWSAALSQYVLVPEDLHHNPPAIFAKALAVASHLGMPDLDGVMYGTQVKRTNAVTGAARARLLVWCNASRQNYKVTDVNPLRQNSLQSTSPWQDSSCVMFSAMVRRRRPAISTTSGCPT